MTKPLGDERPIPPLGSRTLTPELGQQPIHSQKGRRGGQTSRRPVARPRVGVGLAGAPGTYRIEHDVPTQLQQIAVPVNYDRLEAPLQDVTDTAVAAVEGLGVDTVDLAHGFRQIGFGRFHDQMEVIVHQAVGV